MSFLHFRSLVARNCPLLHVNGKRTQKAALFAPGPLFDSRFSSSSSSLILLPSFFLYTHYFSFFAFLVARLLKNRNFIRLNQ